MYKQIDVYFTVTSLKTEKNIVLVINIYLICMKF